MCEQIMLPSVCVLMLAWLSLVNAYVVMPISRCNYRHYCGAKAADEDWGSNSIEEYESLLDLSSSIEPTKSNYNFLLDELSITDNNEKKDNDIGMYTLPCRFLYCLTSIFRYSK